MTPKSDAIRGGGSCYAVAVPGVGWRRPGRHHRVGRTGPGGCGGWERSAAGGERAAGRDPDPEARPGEKLPSGNELAQRYGVARMTTQQAMHILRDEGLIVSRQGSGVFVRERTTRAVALRWPSTGSRRSPASWAGTSPTRADETQPLPGPRRR
jgi:Bacterial regulatory proteins, gntR family